MTYAFSTWVATGLGLLVGSVIDRSKDAHRPLRVFTTLSALSVALLSLVPGRHPFLLLGFAFLGNASFILATLAYTSMLRAVTGDANLVAISGRGVAASYLGALSGMLVWIGLTRFVLHDGEFYIFTFAALAWFLSALPLLLQDHPPAAPTGTGSRQDRAVSRQTQLWFLLGVLLVTAGLHGTALNMVAYLEQIHAVASSRAQEIWVVGVVAVIAGAGAVGAFGKLVERHPYSWLMVSILAWCAAVACLAFGLNRPLLIVVVALAGVASGSILGGLRGEFAAITNAGRQGTSFGTYFLFQRVGQGIGPLFWILVQSKRSTFDAALSPSPLAMAILGLGGVVMFALAKRSDRSHRS